MTKKKILIFSLAYFPKHVGGAEVAIKEITDRISTNDIEFHMVTNRFDSTLPKIEQVGNVLVHRIGITKENPIMADLSKWPLRINKILFQFLAAWKASRLHRTHHYDGIWAMMAHSCGVPAAQFKIVHPRVPFLLTLQEGDPIEYIEDKMRPLWPLFKRAFTSADKIQAISTFLGKWARKRGFTGDLEIIPNGVSIKHFSQEYSDEEIQKAKMEIGKKTGDVYLVTTSRLVIKNAIDDVIRALAHLPENVHFLVFGTGPDEEKLKMLAEEKGVSDRVIFWGSVDHADMPRYLKACDIFIRPSRSEGMGNSFVEAFAAELPVITTQEGGIADFLFDEKRNPDKETTGWAVDKDSSRQIVEAVVDICSYPEKVRKVVQNAKKLAEDLYDWDTVSKNMKERGFTSLLS
jgi:glycosyltransferase involved in cell wall biosynthesis